MASSLVTRAQYPSNAPFFNTRFRIERRGPNDGFGYPSSRTLQYCAQPKLGARYPRLLSLDRIIAVSGLADYSSSTAADAGDADVLPQSAALSYSRLAPVPNTRKSDGSAHAPHRPDVSPRRPPC
jgi:hypothetical protein